MSFERPWILFLLMLPLAMVILGWARHGAKVVVPFDHGDFESRRFGFFVLRLAASLPALLLAVTIVIFAGRSG